MQISIHSILINFILIFTFIFTSCHTSIPKDEPVITFQKYSQMNWKEKIEYLKSLTIDPENKTHQKILDDARKDPEILIVESYLLCVSTNSLESEKKQLQPFIYHSNPIIRWRALNALGKLQSDRDDLKTIVSRFNDKEWLVRESAFRLVRKYIFEKKEKKYYLTILLHLNEKNPNVLREVIRTLKWYNDSRTYSYLLRRSYFTVTDLALIVIMQELVYYDTTTVEKRLQKINHSHKSLIVREEAARLLDWYF